jgi:hypothetical protein
MLAFSGDFTAFKSTLLFLLLSLSFFDCLFKVKEVNVKFITFIFVWISLFFASYIHGMFNSFEFSFSLFSIYTLTPILAVVIASPFNESRLCYLNKIIIFSTFLIILLNLYYIFFRLGVVSMPATLLSLNSFGGVEIGNERLEVRLSSQASLIFLLPYVSTLLFIGHDNFKLKNIALSLILLLGFIVVIFSGRRSLQIVVFMGIFFNLFLYSMKKKVTVEQLVYFVLYLLTGIIIFYLIFDFISFLTNINNPISAFWNTVIIAFDSSEGGGVLRALQSTALLEYFSLSPLFGHGLNSHPLYIRNIMEPWSYEWVYLALLAQVGIILFMFLIASIFLVANKLFVRYLTLNNNTSCIFAAILNGYFCFIIAGSSNPMVYFIWFWSISLIAFNPVFDKNNVEYDRY